MLRDHNFISSSRKACSNRSVQFLLAREGSKKQLGLLDQFALIFITGNNYKKELEHFPSIRNDDHGISLWKGKQYKKETSYKNMRGDDTTEFPVSLRIEMFDMRT